MTVGRVRDFPTGRTPGYASGGHLKGGPTIGTKKGSKLKIDIPGGLPRSSASTDDPSAPENALASRGRIARSRAGMPGLGNTARRSAIPMMAAPGALSSPMAAPVAGPKRDIASMKKGGKAKHRYAEGGEVETWTPEDGDFRVPDDAPVPTTAYSEGRHMSRAERDRRRKLSDELTREGNRKWSEQSDEDHALNLELQRKTMEMQREHPNTLRPRMIDEPEGAPAPAPRHLQALQSEWVRKNPRVSAYAKGGKVHDDAAMDRRMIDAAMKRDDAEDKRMAKSAIRQHETQEHGGKHSTIKLAKGGSVADQAGLDAANKKAEARIAAMNIRAAEAPRRTTKPAKNARSYPAFACGGSVKSSMPQMYGNDAKRRGR